MFTRRYRCIRYRVHNMFVGVVLQFVCLPALLLKRIAQSVMIFRKILEGSTLRQRIVDQILRVDILRPDHIQEFFLMDT